MPDYYAQVPRHYAVYDGGMGGGFVHLYWLLPPRAESTEEEGWIPEPRSNKDQ